MAKSAAACVERATSDMLNAPDWAMNIEICDIINMNPGQGKDALKVLKKRLGSKNPKIQLLALFVLETLSKNCGENVYQQIVERDILHEMVKIVKKKPDLNVREKVLILIDTWQEAFGGPRGRYPQYYAAYQDLKNYGVEYPPRAENNVPLFTPPQSQPIHAASTYEDAAIEISLHSDASGLSLEEIQNAQGLAVVLLEMLSALDPHSPEGVKQEVIIDLVDQCRSYQKRVMLLVHSTGDENLLIRGLTLNDDLQRVLRLHDDIVEGNPTVGIGAGGTSVAPLVNVNNEDYEAAEDFSQLSHRSSRDGSQGQSKRSTNANNPIYTDVDSVDYLSGDAYKSGTLSRQPKYDEPAEQVIPPPPSKFNKRQQFFEKHEVFSANSSNSSGGSGLSYDGLEGRAQNLSLTDVKSETQESSTPKKQAKPEDLLFKDLVDFARAKSSSPKPGNHNSSY